MRCWQPLLGKPWVFLEPWQQPRSAATLSGPTAGLACAQPGLRVWEWRGSRGWSFVSPSLASEANSSTQNQPHRAFAIQGQEGVVPRSGGSRPGRVVFVGGGGARSVRLSRSCPACSASPPAWVQGAGGAGSLPQPLRGQRPPRGGGQVGLRLPMAPRTGSPAGAWPLVVGPGAARFLSVAS